MTDAVAARDYPVILAPPLWRSERLRWEIYWPIGFICWPIRVSKEPDGRDMSRRMKTFWKNRNCRWGW
jgi:hypothetical protein